MIRPLFNHGSLNMETKSNNILVKKKYSNYRLLYENENNNLTKLHEFGEILVDSKLTKESKRLLIERNYQ